MWRATKDMTREELIKLAAARSRVLIDDGRMLVLVGWPARGRRARVEGLGGKRFTVMADKVLAADDGSSLTIEPPRPGGRFVHSRV